MVNTTLIKILVQDKKNEVKKVGPTQENERCWFTLKELEEKKYHFLEPDVPSILEDLLQKKVIELPECKRPKKWVVLMIRTIVITIKNQSPDGGMFHLKIPHNETCKTRKNSSRSG